MRQAVRLLGTALTGALLCFATAGAIAASVDLEATADRIVGFALGMRGIFSRQNSELSHDEMMARFEAEIRRGIGEGFGQARGVLGGLQLLEGQVQDNVDKTWDLVQRRLNDFFRPAEDE